MPLVSRVRAHLCPTGQGVRCKPFRRRERFSDPRKQGFYLSELSCGSLRPVKSNGQNPRAAENDFENVLACHSQCCWDSKRNRVLKYMTLLSLNIQDRPAALSHEMWRSSAPLRLSFPKVDRGLLPGRGLVCSWLAHVLVICGILFGPGYYSAPAPSHTKDLEAEDLSESKQVIYLPKLGGGSEGNGYSGGGSIIKRKGAATVPAHSSPGISYPGPQAILSDPPQPTNRFQTLLRPALKNPPLLKAFVSAPNIVQSTNAGPLPVFDSEKPVLPKLPLSALKAPIIPNRPDVNGSEQAPTILPTTAALTLPASAPRPPSLPVPQMTAPKAPTLRADTSAAPQFSPVPTSGEDLQNLLSLSPTPAPPALTANLPDGEARGRFAISPELNPGPPEMEPGSKSQGPAPLSVAIGSEAEVRPGNAASEGPSGLSNGSPRLAIGGSGGVGLGTGKESGNGNGGSGSSYGGGSATGEGLGTGTGANAGAGSGAGVAEGGGSFRGITIGGAAAEGGPGSLDPRFVTSMVYPVPVALVSKLRRNPVVVSTGSIGGGGLDVYGALNCGKIYTIFLPMPGTNWTMQYCQEAGPTGDTSMSAPSTVVRVQPALVPPSPDSESRFDFQRLPVPPEKARKMIVLKGILGEDGAIDNLQVYKGVLPQMDQAARLAFSRWKFKPAMRENKPVSVEILVGVPAEIPSVDTNSQPQK